MGNIFQKTYIDVHEAAQSGHIDEVRRWVDEGKPVDARDNTQKTPLHYAAQWGQEEALDFLIECGADVNAADFIEDTPLHLACYFGHANCARILIMVGANIGAKDCYGNTPSQIFDDHVTERVLDEIRFIVREVVNDQTVLPDPEHEAKTARASGLSQESSPVGGRHHHSPTSMSPRPSYPTRAGADSSGALSGGGGGRPSESVLAGSWTGTASGKSGQSGAPDKGEATVASAVSAALEGVKPTPPSIASQSSGSVVFEGEGDGDRRNRYRTSSSSVLGQQQRQQPQEEAGRGGGEHDRTGKAKGDLQHVDTAAGERGVVPCLSSRSFHGRGLELSETGPPDPCLKLALPWEEGEALAGGQATAAADSSSGVSASARTVGPGGSAAVGLTYPGPRPLSAPLIRPVFGTGRLNATSPILSGRRFEETNVGRDKDLSRSLGRTAGVSLAGRLMSYATRPNGKFDVFAAARDGQVSVLKQALAEGEQVDVQDEKGLTALMWAARAGRLSTAKYLVAQGASLTSTDVATGFSPLHFAAYYCRSSVVRVLVLAGADSKATDNHGNVPGARFQALSYLSYEAFHHRRLIGRFLAGDLQDGMDDKGKTMFPMNSPLEAYDEEHRPQCVGLGSADNMASDQSSTERERGSPLQGGRRASNYGRKRSSAQDNPDRKTSHRRASADVARKAYATMHTMHSRVVDDGDSLDKHNSMSEDVGAEGSGGGGRSSVRYYLRRGSIKQLAEKTKQILSGGAPTSRNYNVNNDGNHGDGNRPRSASSQEYSAPSSRRLPSGNGAGKGAEGGVNFYLRRASLQGLPFLENFLAGDARGGGGGTPEATSEVADNRRNTSSTHNTRGNDNGDENPSAGIAKAMITAVANAEAAAAASDADDAASAKRDASNGSEVRRTGVDKPNVLERVEARRGSNSSLRDVRGDSSDSGSSNRGDELDRREGREGGGEAAGTGRAGVRKLSASLLEGVQDGRREVTAHLEGHSAPRTCHRQSPDTRSDHHPVYESTDIEAGMRIKPPPHESKSHLASLALEQSGESQQHPQQLPQQQQQPLHRKSAATAAADSHNYPRAKIVAEFPSDHGGGDDSSLVGSRGEGGGRAGTAGTADRATMGITTVAELPFSSSPVIMPEQGGNGASKAEKEEHGYEASIAAAAAAAALPSERSNGNIVDTATPPPREGGEAGRHIQLNKKNASSAVDTRLETDTAAETIQEGATVTTAKRVSPGAKAPPMMAAGLPSEQAPMSETRCEDALDPQERETQPRATADEFDATPQPSSARGDDEKENVIIMGGGVDQSGPKIDWEEESGRRSEGRSGGEHKPHKHKHKHKRHHHRHRDRDATSGDEGAGRKNRRRRKKDHDLLGGTAGPSTITTLAPLKRVPSPSSVSGAETAIEQEVGSGGDDGGGGGRVGVVGDGGGGG